MKKCDKVHKDKTILSWYQSNNQLNW